MRLREPSTNQFGDIVAGLALFGILSAGGIGLMRACDTPSALDAAACLAVAAASFGIICFINLRRP